MANYISSVKLPGSNNTYDIKAKVVAEVQLTNENLNDLKPDDVTWYYAGGSNSVTNNPETSGTAFGMVAYRNAVGYRAQELYSSNGKKWIRYWNSSSWSTWEQMYGTSHKPSTADIGAATSGHTHGNITNDGKMTGSTASGAVTTSHKFLREDGTWVIPSYTVDTWRGIQDNLTSSSNTTESLSAKQGYLLANGSARDSTKLPKITYEYNKEISFSQSGKLLIGKFPCYDSNITIQIFSTTNTTYHAVAIMATQNINTSGGGTIKWNTYGDSSNTVTPNLYAKYASGSRFIEIYFSPSSWSKNAIHISCVALADSPTNICENISSIPDTATIQPINTIASTYATKTEMNGLLAAADAMVFKGTLGTGGTITAVPDGTSGKEYQAGYTYKIITAGTYAGVVCETGDLLIAIADSTSGQTAVNDAHWTVVQTNIDGAVTGPTSNGADGNIVVFNGTSGRLIKDSAKAFSTTTPSSSSTDAQIPTAKAVWAAIDALDGNLNSTTPGSGKTLTAFSQTDGKISATFGNISITKSQISDFPSTMTPSSHEHGNISNDGKISETEAIGANYRLVIVKPSNASANADKNKVITSSIVFDGSTATKALTQKGTWETFNNYSHPTDAGNKHIPSGGSNGQFLKYGDSSGTATWSALPTASTDTAGIIQIGTGASNAMAGNTNVNNVSQGTTTTGNWRKVLLSGNDYAAYNTAVGNDQNTVTYRAVGIAVQPSTGSMELSGGLELHGHIAGDAGSSGHGLWSGGGYHNAYNNIILHGDASTGTSGIAFVSDKGTTNLNQPSDRAFIQWHGNGVTTFTAENTAPTLATSGEANQLIIGVGNDANDQVRLQTPSRTGLLHQVGANGYVIPDTNNTSGDVGGTTTPVYVSGGAITAGTALGGAAYKAADYYALASHGLHVPTLPTSSSTSKFLRGDNAWSDTLVGPLNLQGKLNLCRSSNTAYGRISYYSDAYYTWFTYMSNVGNGLAPTGGKPGVLGDVTSWAMRSLIEQNSGHGWIWESATNAAAASADTTTKVRMSLSSYTGKLRIAPDASSTSNESAGLIVDSAKNGSSGNVAIELWRGANASWQIANESGTLYLRNNYTNAKQTTYTQTAISIAYNTNNTTLTGTSTAFATDIFNVKNSSDVTWTPSGSFLAPNLTATHYNAIQIGKKNEDKNVGHLSFYYAGDKSTSNRFALGFYSVTDILVVRADKRVGINNTAPAHDLAVKGDTASTKYIVTDGAATPADKVTLQWNSTDSSLDFIFA